MAVLTHDAISDFTYATISNFKKLKYNDISLEHQYYVSQEILDEKRVVEDGGDQIKFDLKRSNTGTFRNNGLYSQDATSDEDVLTQGAVPWTKQTSATRTTSTCPSSRPTKHHRPPAEAQGAQRAQRLRRRQRAEPVDRAQQHQRQAAVRHSLLGQEGRHHDRRRRFQRRQSFRLHRRRAGISSTTYTNWRNWTFGYTNVSRPTTSCGR
jgi:hypothetical protein